MNRDESLARAAAHPPQVFTRAGRLALYPTESTGGSWVGVNDAGITVALINWYAIPRAAGIGRVSRGSVVPAVLAAADAEEARTAIAALSKRDMAPFRLLAFAPCERTVREFRWDQQTLDEVPHAWAPRHWFSSGHDEPRTQHTRGDVAREAWRDLCAGRLPWLRRLHASHAPERGPFCFCMHRMDAATVSYTEIALTRRTATMRYHDGPLCTTPHPTTAHEIPWPTGCKEFPLIPTNQPPEHRHENHQSSFQPSRRPLLPSGISPGRYVLKVAR
jgi:hypothetical protein